MCGINGINSPNKALVKAMNQVIRHRGPDDEGVFVDDRVSLGNCRLKIIDLSDRGHQPMCNEDETIWITFNGEIYNYMELRKHLESLGHSFASNSDTEVILHGYEEWGKDVLTRLIGMWAFAIYDSKRKRLFLARDRMGIKPLYYLVSNGLFAFSSEMKTFAMVDELRRLPSKRGLLELLAFGFNPFSHTALDSVYKLRAGEYLIYDLVSKELKKHRYWSCATASVREYNSAKLSFLLEEAMRRHLVSDVPVGCYVSGGIDSSIVALYYGKLYSGSLHTFTVGFDCMEDERTYGRILADHIGSIHHERIIEGEEVARSFSVIVRYYDISITDPAFIPNLLISKDAKKWVKVVLAGEGGDEIFGGYDHYRALYLARKLRIDSVLSSLVPSKAACLLTILPTYQKDRLLKAFYLMKEGKQSDLFLYYYYSSLPVERLKALLDFDSVVDSYSATTTLNDTLPSSDPIESILKVDQQFLLSENYNYKADKSTSAASLEERVPLQDVTIVEYMNSLPIHHKLNFRVGKIPLRTLLSKELPLLGARRKHGYGTPIEQWLRILAPQLESAVNDRSLTSLVDPYQLHKMYSRFTHGLASQSEPFFLWNVMVVAHSLREYAYADFVSSLP